MPEWRSAFSIDPSARTLETHTAYCAGAEEALATVAPPLRPGFVRQSPRVDPVGGGVVRVTVVDFEAYPARP